MTKETKEGWRRFLKLCAELNTEKELEELFDFFLTLQEKEALAKRYLLSKELLHGKKTQREIAKDLSLSIAKITRGSNALKTTPKKLQELIKNN